MTATFCLAASDHPGSQRWRAMIRELLGDAPRETTACVIGAPHGDDPAWIKRCVRAFQDVGIACTAPRLSRPSIDVDEARAQIEGAGVLYLDGGDTLELVGHAKRHGLERAFKNAAKKARLVTGLSGGACACSPFTIGYDDEDRPFVAPCLDLGIPHPMDVHDEDDWPEMRALLEIVPDEKDAVGIVVPTGSALVRTPEGELRSRGKAPCELRRLGRGGVWVVEKI